MAVGCVLLVDDDPLVRQSLSLSLQDQGFEVTTASGGQQAVELSRQRAFEVVVCDIRMPGLNGIETLRTIKQAQPDVRTIVITGYADDPNAPLEAIRLGVDDYLVKPFSDELLHHSVAENVARLRLERENARLCQELSEANATLQRDNARLRRQANGRHALDDIVGNSAAMAAVRQQLEPVLDSDITVLLTGETGTGKDLLARAIHYSGRRRDGSFVPVHCGAVQESLLESELFGVIPHYPGLHSPTGKRGLFEEADGGTLFLDEIGEMAPAMQTKLLRALQDGEVLRVGDTQPRRMDVRVLAATGQCLEAQVEAGQFRADLYYRLAGIEVHLPPLHARRQDIPELAAHFLEDVAARNGASTPALSSAALDALVAYSWPGNVRELEKEIERAATLARRAGTERVAVDLSEVLRSTLALLRHHLEQSGISLDVEAAALPPIQGNFSELCTVVTNLIINARDALGQVSPEAGRLLRIRADRVDGRVRLSVEDNGPGMSPEVQQRIFDPFYTTKEVGQGTGLGLAMVRAIVERHGGSISVDSSPGRGATFTVYLPVLADSLLTYLST